MDTRLKDGESSDINPPTRIRLIISCAIRSVQFGVTLTVMPNPDSPVRISFFVGHMDPWKWWLSKPGTRSDYHSKYILFSWAFCLTGWKLVDISPRNGPRPFLFSPFCSLLFPFPDTSHHPNFLSLRSSDKWGKFPDYSQTSDGTFQNSLKIHALLAWLMAIFRPNPCLLGNHLIRPTDTQLTTFELPMQFLWAKVPSIQFLHFKTPSLIARLCW